MTDGELAAHLATAAGKLLLGVRAARIFSGDALGKLGDQIANQFLVSAIRAQRPHDGLLSEEMHCDGARLTHARVWIIDPVDGTREYGEGRDDWAVHVGLAIDGVASVGAVALPGLGLVLTTDARSSLPAPRHPPRMVVSRTRPPPAAQAVATALGAELMPMGSAGAKAMAVVRGDADIYLHTGGQYEWDSCAPVAVAAAHGLHCSRVDGSALVYNRADASIPDLLICRPDEADRILALIRNYRAG